MFRVVSSDEAGQDFEDEVDIVIDATGVITNWGGEGGLPALG